MMVQKLLVTSLLLFLQMNPVFQVHGFLAYRGSTSFPNTGSTTTTQVVFEESKTPSVLHLNLRRKSSLNIIQLDDDSRHNTVDESGTPSDTIMISKITPLRSLSNVEQQRKTTTSTVISANGDITTGNNGDIISSINSFGDVTNSSTLSTLVLSQGEAVLSQE